MKKSNLISIILLMILFSCRTETKNERVDYKDIEVEYYKFYKKNSKELFSGVITANLSTASIEFEVKNGIKSGVEIIISNTGDTISYNKYDEKGKKVITRVYSKGERLYTTNFEKEKISDFSDRKLINVIIDNIKSNNYNNLDNLTKKRTSLMFGEKFWEKLFALQNKTIGKVLDIEVNSTAEFVNNLNDTITEIDYLLKFDKSKTNLNMRLMNDSISGLTLPSYQIDIIPNRIINEVLNNLKNNKIKELFNNNISVEQYEKLKDDLLKFGKLKDDYKFKQHYTILPINGTHKIASDYIIEYENNNEIIKYVLTIKVLMKDGELKYEGFNIQPLRASIYFNNS